MGIRHLGLVTLAACTFTPPGAPAGGGDDSGADAGITPTPLGTCSVAETKLCLEFETDHDPMAIALDLSGLGHDASATNVTLANDSPHQPATDVQAGELLTTSSSLTVAETADLDIAGDLTIEMWVSAFAPLTGVRYWLVDHSDHYFMSIGDDRQLRCGINHDKSVDSNTQVVLDGVTWHHVACTFSVANQGEIRAYVDGNVTDCARTDETEIANMPGTTTIGVKHGSIKASEHFYGDLDNVHVFAKTVSADDVCHAAGRTGCTTTCPAGGEGGQGPGGPLGH